MPILTYPAYLFPGIINLGDVQGKVVIDLEKRSQVYISCVITGPTRFVFKNENTQTYTAKISIANGSGQKILWPSRVNLGPGLLDLESEDSDHHDIVVFEKYPGGQVHGEVVAKNSFSRGERPDTIFDSGRNGFIIGALDNAIWQDTDLVDASTTSGDPVAVAQDESFNGFSAIQQDNGLRPVFNETPNRLSVDKSTQHLLMEIPEGGLSGAMIYATNQGVFRYDVKIPEGSYSPISGPNEVGDTKGVPTLAGDPGGVHAVVFVEGYLLDKDFVNTKANLVEEFSINPVELDQVTDLSSYWKNMSEITRLYPINTSAATSIFEAWYGCTGLTSFPLIDLSNVTIARNAWVYCSGLKSFPPIDLSSATNIRSAWNGCSGLTEFPLIDISSAETIYMSWRDCSSLTEFPLLDTSSGTDFNQTWGGCSSLTEFPLLDTSSGMNFNRTWINCSGLNEFPLIDTSNGTVFSYTWQGCTGLMSFPAIDLSSAELLDAAWRNCSSLTSFPAINMPNVTNIDSAWSDCYKLTEFPVINLDSATSAKEAWQNCASLTSFPALNLGSLTRIDRAWQGCSNLKGFPAINIPSLTNATRAWENCPSLTDFPPGVFDGCTCINFENSFTNTNLTTESIDNILVSINSNGTSDGTFDQSGGQAPSEVGEAAIDDLRSRGWTVNVTGGHGAFNIIHLFNESQDGIIIDPATMESMFQDEAGTTPVSADGQTVFRKESIVNGYVATQSTASEAPLYKDTGGPPRLVLDRSNDHLEMTVPAGGFNGTMVLATPQGTAAYGVSIPEGGFEIGGQGYYYNASFPTGAGVNGGIIGMVIRDGAMSQNEINDSIGWLIDRRNAGPLNYAGITDVSEYWGYHNWITEFPLIDTSSVTNAQSAWLGCSGLTEFPSIDLSSVTNAVSAWRNCAGLTEFPSIDLSSVTNAVSAWRNCSSLEHFPAGVFDGSTCTNFTGAFTSTNLSEQSIDNILVSINSNGTSNGTFDQSGGSQPSSVGQQAADEMRSRGWTVTLAEAPPLGTFANEAAFEADDTITVAMIEDGVSKVEITDTGYDSQYGTTHLLYENDPGGLVDFFFPIVNQNGVWARLNYQF